MYISRVSPDALELVSGYMDETGAFVVQAQVPLTVNTTEFRLDCMCTATPTLFKSMDSG